MAHNERPLPVITEDSREYWQACRRHELLIQRCQACGRLQFYPRAICSHCMSDDVAWHRASGLGAVYSYSVVYRPPSTAFASDVPYVVAIVELSEGVRMMANIVNCSPQDVRIGLPVEVAFAEVTPEITLPQFRPAASTASGKEVRP